MIIGDKKFDTKNHTYIMGILNVTPDSFSDGGKFLLEDQALKQVKKMIGEGADIIDIGGESSRPGYVKITVEEEIQRIAPIIEKVKDRFNIPISLDTYKAKVAKAGN
jgi:dihydropteroate synthase